MIKIPKTFMGKPIEGSTKKALGGNINNSNGLPLTGQPTSGNAPDISGFEYVPSAGIYVSKARELKGKNWNDCQGGLHARGDRMPTPYEFVEFIKQLRTKNDSESKQILDDIYKVGGNWRAEWLGAKFEVDGNNVKMRYHEFNSGVIVERVKDLTGILMGDKTPGISMDSWLQDNESGIPKLSNPTGDLYYWCPRNGTVAGFGALSGRADLGCYWYPTYSNPALGVRAVRRFEKNLGGSV